MSTTQNKSKKVYIWTDQMMAKPDNTEEITDKEMDSLMDDMLEVIEKHGFITAGMWKLMTEEEMEKHFDGDKQDIQASVDKTSNVNETEESNKDE